LNTAFKILQFRMKFFASFVSLLVGVSAASHKLTDIKADSKMGLSLLSKARKLNNNQNQNQVDMTWVTGYSLKFQGCHHVSQWNDEADDKNDVRVQTKRLIRFRLCPTGSCSITDAAGCSSDYGDYIVDMNTYLAAYYDSVDTINEYKCQEIMNNCDCENADNRETCEYDCYVAKGMESICADKNPYEEDGNNNKNEKFNIGDYAACGKWEYKANRRQLNNNNNKYYMGPYCAENGGAIFLGLFTDDTCTTFLDESGGAETYLATTGVEMPYAAESIIGMDCVSCTEPTEYNVDGNDADDEDTVSETCETVYSLAGKCEEKLSAAADPNNNACTYMQGIKIIRTNGSVQSMSGTNKTASVFIGLFVVSFILLAAYVYYLRTKLDRASINLSE